MNGSQLENICKTGDLETLIKLKRIGLCGPSDHINRLFEIAGSNGHINILYYMQVLRTMHRVYISKYEVEYLVRMASNHNHLPIIKYLMENYPNDNHKDIVLNGAVDGNHILLVRYALDNLKSGITNSRDRPLCLATTLGHTQLVKYLVERGANINCSNSYALKIAVRNRNIILVKYLLLRGANLRPISKQSLRISARNGDLPMLKLLVQNGADLYTAKQDCMDIATRKGHTHIVKWLIKQVTLEK